MSTICFYKIKVLQIESTVRSTSMDEETRWLQWAERQFTAIAGEDHQIDLDEFKRALKVKKVCNVYSFLYNCLTGFAQNAF